MNKIDFVKPNDPILVKVAQIIPTPEITSSGTKKVINKMLKVAYGEQKDRSKPLLVGLAAPQIGISKRVILVDVKADGKGHIGDLRVYINPEITWKSDKSYRWYEGCFSTDRICGIVSRPSSIKIKGYTEDRKLISEKYEGYTARIFQHEIDHLNGKEFVTHIKNDKDLHWVKENEFPKYRNNQGWKGWHNKCSRARWYRTKGRPLTFETGNISYKDFEFIVGEIKKGSIGVVPTDTIYGIVGSAFKKETVERIYKLRKRNKSKPMIILISSLKDLQLFNIELTEKQKKFLKQNWPNPLSVVLSCDDAKFKYLHRGKKSLAFRMPKDNFLQKLLRQTRPLVAPSANFEGEKPSETTEDAKSYFEDKVSFYLDGGKIKGKPSTLIEFEKNKVKILRQGDFRVRALGKVDF